MTVTAIQMQRPAAPAITPVWMVLSIGGVGVAMALAAWAGGQWPLTVVVMILLAGALALVVSRPHIGISFFLTTFLINYPGVAKGVGYLTINNVMGALFLGLLAWDYYQNRDAWYLREPLVRLLIAIGGGLVIGTIIAEYTLPEPHIQQLVIRRIGARLTRLDYTERWLFQYFSRVAFTVFMMRFIRTPDQLRWVFLTLLGCILAAVPLALTQYGQGGENVSRAFSRVINWADSENRFAFGCVLGVGFMYYLFMIARSAWAKVSAAAGACMLLPLVLLAASRSGFLGLLVLGSLIIFGAFGVREGGASRATGAAVTLLLGLVALITFFFVLEPKARERVLNLNPFATGPRLEGAASTEQRAATAQESLALIRMYPGYGVGIGNFRWVNKYHHDSFKPPHNSYLWAAVEGGALVLVAYLVLFRLTWRRLGRLRAVYARRRDLPYFPDWLRVYMVLFLFYSFFADIWIEEHIFLIIAAVALLDRWRERPPEGALTAPTQGSPRVGDIGYARLAPESALAGVV